MSSKWFRYGFFALSDDVRQHGVPDLSGRCWCCVLREAVVVLDIPCAVGLDTQPVQSLIGWAQFSFGFYSLMLTSLLLGLIVMVLYKPRTWCAFCPMGTMTQGICKLKNKE